LALKTALETHNVPGKIILLGTPGSFHLFITCFCGLLHFLVFSGRRRRWKGDAARKGWLRRHGCLHHVCSSNPSESSTWFISHLL
jgi:hypothetical protein